MTGTVYLIHGMSVGPWCWQNYIRVLENSGYTCIAASLPFHADSSATPDVRLGTLSLLDYAAFLEAEIRKLGTKPILIGHSMGGLLAQILASRGLAQAVVLVTPAAPAGILSAKWAVFRSFGNIITTWGFWRKPVRQTFGDVVYGVLNLCPAEERRATYDRMGWESGRAIFEMGFWFLDRRNASHVDESKVTCPTLVIAGGQDRMTPAAISERIAQRYQAVSTYRVFPDHAHWILAEPGWEEVAAEVLAWIDRSARPARTEKNEVSPGIG